MTAMPENVQETCTVDVEWGSRVTRIEYEFIHPDRVDSPLLVFLHEGLGSRSMWKDFPAAVCTAANCRGLVFSRWGYGKSSPRAAHEHWPVEFMHDQANLFLPAFFRALGIDTRADRPWLYGHSDGGSIALIHAATHPGEVAGLILAAPHIFVEDLTILSIEEARSAYQTTDLRSRLARYHDDVDSAFWGWNDIWLNPAFRAWDIRPLLPDIQCPILAIQGYDDQYGTMAQIDGIAHALPQTRLLKLASCGHSPHRDQPQQVIEAVRSFLQAHASAASG